ncbi:hypothetical protein BH23PLA1_BH23PLA1_26800 [soil metagenome]
MYDLVVLGGGSGGLNVATASAAVGAKVALIEAGKLGGECTHTACVPSKALIQAAELVERIRSANVYGLNPGPLEIDFRAVMDRVREVVASFAGSDSGQSLEAKGIDVFRGSPAFDAYDTVLVDGQERISGRRFVIATGSRPAVPPIPGLEEAGYLTNNSFWDLSERPDSLAIIGGGAVGVEFGQALARLGVEVTILEMGKRLLPMEDPEVSELVQDLFQREGIKVFTDVEVIGVERRDDKKVVKFRRASDGMTYEAVRSEILLAAGRRVNVEGLNLESVGVKYDPTSGIEVNEYLQTRAPTIYAVGDVLGHHQWTHAAEREASVAFQNAVLRLSKKIDYSAMPWATFTDPEVATVGRTFGLDDADEPRIFRVEYDDIDRPRIEGRTRGFAKLAATPSGKILGVTVIGDHAAMVLQEFVFAMEHGRTLNDIVDTVHPYPTHAGLARNLANQFAATRLETGWARTALRWFYGFTPRVGGDKNGNGSNTEARPERAEAHGPGDGH